MTLAGGGICNRIHLHIYKQQLMKEVKQEGQSGEEREEKTARSTEDQPLRPVEALLLENQEILAEVLVQAKYRKNKNIITPKMSLLINSIERNIIRIARMTTPDSLADPTHVMKEKERFLRFYQKRNGAKKHSMASASLPAGKPKES